MKRNGDWGNTFCLQRWASEWDEEKLRFLERSKAMAMASFREEGSEVELELGLKSMAQRDRDCERVERAREREHLDFGLEIFIVV